MPRDTFDILTNWSSSISKCIYARKFRIVFKFKKTCFKLEVGCILSQMVFCDYFCQIKAFANVKTCLHLWHTEFK